MKCFKNFNSGKRVPVTPSRPVHTFTLYAYAWCKCLQHRLYYIRYLDRTQDCLSRLKCMQVMDKSSMSHSKFFLFHNVISAYSSNPASSPDILYSSLWCSPYFSKLSVKAISGISRRGAHGRQVAQPAESSPKTWVRSDPKVWTHGRPAGPLTFFDVFRIYARLESNDCFFIHPSSYLW